jgi:hypothetical protein
MTGDFYQRALRRILWLTAGVGVVGSAGILISRGVRPAAGFLFGAALSLINCRLLYGLANALGGSAGARPGISKVFLALRYVILGTAAYVIVRVSGITPAAVVIGLLSAFAAVILEVLYELIFHARA